MKKTIIIIATAIAAAVAIAASIYFLLPIVKKAKESAESEEIF